MECRGCVLTFQTLPPPLWWIKTNKPLKVFVANRICTILDCSNLSQWRYVNTKENPADIPTRTTTIQTLATKQLWWWGPTFLTQPDHLWPAQPVIRETEECVRGDKIARHDTQQATRSKGKGIRSRTRVASLPQGNLGTIFKSKKRNANYGSRPSRNQMPEQIAVFGK